MKKYLFVTAIIFISLLLTQSLFAQNKSIKAIAEVNIQGAKIANQVGNILNISFALSNGAGVQSDVIYGIRLTPKDKPQVVADEKFYAEGLNLAENSVLKKNIIYTVPAGLSGAYKVSILASNSAGFPFGIAYAGEVTLSATSGAMVIPGSCVLMEKNTKISCGAQNLAKSLSITTPTLSISKGPSYGEELEQSGFSGTTLSLKAGEKKTFTLGIPSGLSAGPYTIKVALHAGDTVSNTVSVALVVPGVSARILNASLDKDYYKHKDNITATLSWSGDGAKSAETKVSSHGVTCGTTNIDLSSRVQTLNITSKISCSDPKINVVIKDSQGKALDTKEFSIKTTSTAPASSQKQLLIIVIVIVLILAMGLILKKKQAPPAVVGTLVFVLALALPLAHVHANTYYAGPNSELLVDVNVNNVQNPGSTIYNNGDTMRIDGAIYNNTSNLQTVSLSAVTVGNTSVQLFSAGQIPVAPLSWVTGDTTFFTVTVPTSPPLPQNFDVTFTAGIEDYIHHTIDVSPNSNGPSVFYSISRSDMKSVDLVVGSLPIYDNGHAEFTTEPGTIGIHTTASMPGCEGPFCTPTGKMVIVDSVDQIFCLNNSGANDYDFSGVVVNNIKPIQITMGDGVCN